MTHLLTQLMNDERGFIVSGELVLISTIGVLTLVCGLAEVSSGINRELEDLGSAFGSMNQSYRVNGYCGHGGNTTGSCYRDMLDNCDGQHDIVGNNPTPEAACWVN